MSDRVSKWLSRSKQAYLEVLKQNAKALNMDPDLTAEELHTAVTRLVEESPVIAVRTRCIRAFFTHSLKHPHSLHNAIPRIPFRSLRLPKLAAKDYLRWFLWGIGSTK